MEKISLELVIAVVTALVSGLYVCLIMIWTKMDQVWKAINKIQLDYVPHQVCASRRKECPCILEMGHLKEAVSKLEKDLEDDLSDISDELVSLKEEVEKNR